MENVLIKPLITEKSMAHAATGKYTFVVAKQANKDRIKQVVQETFNVHVIDVATQIIKGRTKRMGLRRTEIDMADWKKATVTLRPGEKIALFETTGA